MTALEALEQAREKIAKYVILGPRVYELTEWGKGRDVGFRKVVENLDAMISAERERLPDAGETKPEPGDVVGYVYDKRVDGNQYEIIIYFDGADEIYATRNHLRTVVLMRAAEVKRRIEEGK